MEFNLIIEKHKNSGLNEAVQYVLQKYTPSEIEEKYSSMENYPFKKSANHNIYFLIIKNAYNRRYGEPLEKEAEEKLAEEIKNLFYNQDELKKAIEECSKDPLKWYYSSNLSQFTLPDSFDSRFFIKNLLLNKNMSESIANETDKFYLGCFTHSSNDLIFILNNSYLSPLVLKKYLEKNGTYLESIDIIKIINSKKATDEILSLLIDKCFDEELVYKMVSPISPKLWGSKKNDGIPNVKILTSILIKEKISFQIFTKILEKIKKCNLYFKVQDCTYEIGELLVKFLKEGNATKEEVIDFIIEYGYILSSYWLKEIIPYLDATDIEKIVKNSHIRCESLFHFIDSPKANETINNGAIIKSLAQNPSFYFKKIINGIQIQDPSYSNCLCDILKEKCSISGEYNRVFHPLLLTFCISSILDSGIRKKCCSLDATKNIDFDGLDSYFYDNNINSINDLVNENGNLKSEICTNVRKFLGDDLLDLFKTFCTKLNKLFDVEKYELDYYASLKYDNDSDKFIVLYLLISNNVSKDDKLNKFMEEKLENWYKMLYYSEVFKKKLTPNEGMGYRTVKIK